MPLLFILPFVAAGAIFASMQSKETQERWRAAAAQLGLHPKFDNGFFPQPGMTGMIDDVRVEVRLISSSAGNNNNQHFTSYKILHAPSGPPVTMKRETTMRRLGRFFGTTDVVLGDPFFDDRVIVDSPVDDAMRAFLTPARRAVVLELFDRWPDASITHQSIEIRTRGIERSTDRIVGTVWQLVDMAAVMNEPQVINAALSALDDGDLARATDELHAYNEDHSSAFTNRLEAEALIERGDHVQARDLFEPPSIPSEPSALPGGWERLAASPPPGVEPPPVALAVTALDQQSVIEDVFDPSLLSYQIVQRFEERYVNREVHWSGEVTAYNEFRQDADFGQNPGVKATVLLGHSSKTGLLSNEVHAVVHLPAGSDVRRGTEISFRGTLAHVDRFSRKIYVRDAHLG